MEDKNEKKEAPAIRAGAGFLNWLDNFWYHYKWQTLGVLFLLILVIGCTAQCSRVEPDDITVTFAGNYAMTVPEQDAFRGVLCDVIPKDFDGNGKNVASFVQFSIYSEEELQALYTYLDETDMTEKVDFSSLAGAKNYNTERIRSMQNYIMTGDCAVWFVSPYVYHTMFKGKVAVESVTALKDTEFYRYYDAVGLLPPETLIVLTKPTIGYMSKEKNYHCAVEYFKAITEFKAP